MKLPPALSGWFNRRARCKATRKLSEAISRGDARAAQECINRGAELHDFDLVAASKKGHTAVVRVLIRNGANVNAYRDLPLFTAIGGSHFGVATVLIRHGAELSPRVVRYLRTTPERRAYLRTLVRNLPPQKFDP